MLYMREDDMDEMLRKAAENYEIDAARAADWNFVYKAVHEAEGTMPGEKKEKRRRFMFWWLLLIPLGWMANTVYNKFQADGTSQQNTSRASIQTKANESIKSAQSSLPKNSTDKGVIAKNLAEANKSTSIKQPVNKQQIMQQSTHRESTANVYAYDYSSRVGANKVQLPTEMNKPQGKVSIDEPVVKDIASNPSSANTELKKDSAVASEPSNRETVASTSGNKETLDIPAKTKKQAITIKPTDHYFYAGLIAGGDMSFVKYQKAQPLGYNIGLLAGYKFKKLSIESGLLFVKKNYYTDGEYFDKSDIPYFNNAEILTVDGYCRMFEIPLNIKYDFIEKRRHTFFATAGLSSYLMNEEFYNYDYIKNGQWLNGSRAYMHSTQNWFSILNLSAGYQLRTGAKTSIRIEPYFKAPISGIGKGSLPISSLGINAGITRQIP